MKRFLLILALPLLFALNAEAKVQANGYMCKNTGNGVCAVKLSTGQCTHQWEQGDGGNPMFHCKKFIGIKVSNFNKSNYYCRDHGGYVCAASKKTNQCTHSWDQDDHNDPMWSCRKFLGLEKSNFDKSGFQCKKTAGGYCAQSLKTGQCTHEWNNDDHPNPEWSCNNWLQK